ncbi:aspartyl-phosphate phosphatase Spo0E family protein [Paenibacillus sp. NPDC058071]|uniref:aspartyl-phosphate phosphatase Spo0E family protein n=1 Tax=Paenibacillus sp. NPDC058071 TaxID=3346326 RepID=UPI0036DEFE13
MNGTMDKQLRLEMEQLRDKMVESFLVQKTFQNGEVLQLSQSLDVLIVRVQEEQRRWRK